MGQVGVVWETECPMVEACGAGSCCRWREVVRADRADSELATLPAEVYSEMVRIRVPVRSGAVCELHGIKRRSEDRLRHNARKRGFQGNQDFGCRECQ